MYSRPPSAKRKLRSSNKGNMPFALIAVTLLLTSTAFGVIYANIENAEETAENVESEMMSIDDAISETESMITSGLGSIICDLSTAETGGTLIDRTDDFDKMTDAWFAGSFPYRNRGITASIIDHDLDIDVQTMKLSSGDICTDASVASYLVASGTVTLEYVGSTGTSTKTLQVSADGTSGLPFIVDSATKFELKSDSGSSMLAQLMSYQLSALAQSRIVNGYGLRSYYGDIGTANIITDDDVEEAFRNALTVIETICFRCNGENDSDIVNCTQIDLAEMMVLKDGKYVLDMTAILSQAMLSIIDLLVVRWMELIKLDWVVEVADNVNDVLKGLCNDIATFFFHNNDNMENRNSAYIYLKNSMESNGYNESEYRYLMRGETFTVEIENGVLEHDGHTLSYDGGTYTFDFPVTDVFSWSGWDDYKIHYDENKNGLEEFIRGTVVSLCTGIASDYGVYEIPADKFDDEEFADAFAEAINDCLTDSLGNFTSEMVSQLNEGSVSDPFYASMYQTMKDERDSIFKEDQYKEKILDLIYPKIFESTGNELARVSFTDAAKEMIEETVDIDAICEEYTECVDEVMASYEEVLMDVSKQTSSILKGVVVAAGKKVLAIDEVEGAVKAAASLMANDIKKYVNANCSYGLLQMDGLDSFSLYDGNGDIYEEFTKMIDDYTLEIDIIDPSDNKDKCYHRIGIDEISFASYVSVFTVKVSASVDYTAHTMSSVDKALGRYDSSFKDSFSMTTAFDVSCVSGWSLAGVEYPADTDLGNEILKYILKSLEPMFGDLTELYNSVKTIFNTINEAVTELTSYVTDMIETLYEVLMAPIEMLTDFISEQLGDVLSDIVDYICDHIDGFDIGPAKQSISFKIFGMTLTLELKVASLVKKTKNLVKATLEGDIGDTHFSVYIDTKIKEKELLIKFGGGVSNDDVSLNLDIDPLLKFGNKLVSVNGTTRGVDFEVAVPERVLYDEVNIALSDIPAIGQLTKIRIPIIDMEVSIDLGINMKYNLPFETGLMINEFESNPLGSDAGNEWVELYNESGHTIDLDGYTLVPGSNESKAITISGETIGPLEHKVFYFEKQSLNNSKSGKYNGESITLYDPNGEKVDSTPWKKDSYNTDFTWQRECDGSTSWKFAKGTQGDANGKLLKVNSIAKTLLVDTFVEAVDKAFDKMGNHLTTADDIEQFFQYLLQIYVDEIITTIAKMLTSLTVYIQFEFADATESIHKGLKVGFQIGSDMIEQGIYWILEQIGFMTELLEGPKCTDPVELLCTETYLTTSSYQSVSAPKIVIPGGPEVAVATEIGVNIAGICRMFGNDQGEWKAYAGMVIEGIDAKTLPKGLKSNSEKTCDLWLLKATFSEAED